MTCSSAHAAPAAPNTEPSTEALTEPFIEQLPAAAVTSSADVLGAALRLQQAGQPYALVSVLRVQAPASAKPGDKAVVTAQGIQQGWIGGGCAQPAVMRTVRQALADGRARLIRISPVPEAEAREFAEVLDDVLEFGMACHSGGTLDLFVDPVLPAPQLVLIGDTPLAVALAALAPRVGLPVTVIAQDADALRFPDARRVITSDSPASSEARDAGLPAFGGVAPASFVVVATQGRRDIQGLRAALALRARQVFFVASARKAAVLKASLVEAGEDAQQVAAIVAPAGQAIGAQTPEEIALSVLAAVVAARRGHGQPAASALGAVQPAAQPAAQAAAQPAVQPASQVASPPVAAAQASKPGSCCGA